MWHNYQATVIQNFYNRFIKCSRDRNVLCRIKNIINNKRKYIQIPSPIDPLYRIAYKEKYHIRLVEWPSNQKKPCVWHFNIITLVDWLNISRNWNNPMTNCLFLNRTIDKIVEYLEKNNIRKKLKIPVIYNQNEPKPKKMKLAKQETNNGKIYLDLLQQLVIQNKEEDVFNLLHNNYDKIATDYFKIDSDFEMSLTVEDEIINPVGILHIAVFLGRKEIVNHLSYYGCNLDKKIGEQQYTPLHIAAILDYVEIGELLKMYGANLMAECKFGGETATIFDICDIMGHHNFIMKILN